MQNQNEVSYRNMTLTQVQPCGMLYSGDREYFLLHPNPLEADWETGQIERRFLAVPRQPITTYDKDHDFALIYSFARHVVCSSWAVDYAPDMPLIYIVKLQENDLPVINWPLDQDEEVIISEVENREEFPVRDVGDYPEEDGFPL